MLLSHHPKVWKMEQYQERIFQFPSVLKASSFLAFLGVKLTQNNEMHGNYETRGSMRSMGAVRTMSCKKFVGVKISLLECKGRRR